MTMNSHDFEAVVIDGAVYCVGCVGEGTDLDSDEVSPIFADSEHDSYPVCEGCGHEHDYVSLTDEGRAARAAAETISKFHMSAEDRFDAAQGLHWYAVHYHSGQWSSLYRVQCALDYTPGALEKDASADTNEWYARLENSDVDAEDLLAAIKALTERPWEARPRR
jgi:hypothetical protein